VNCVVCNTEMMVVPGEEDRINHPTCPMFTEPFDEDPLARKLRDDLMTIILDAANNDPRTLQKSLGPSDLGTPCDRKIAYLLTETPAVNTRTDPWPATVGQAIHMWLEKTFRDQAGWTTERKLQIGEFISGTSDLYHDEMVIDHKSAGPDVMRKIPKDGPPPEYVVQVQLYGYGYRLAGMPVKKVALAFYPRSGWLSNMYVWVGDYSEEVALAALDRMYRVAASVLDLDIASNPHRFQQIPAVAYQCGFCPFYRPDMGPDQSADNFGCPGS